MTLVEVCVAMAILSTAALTVAELFAITLTMTLGARLQTTATFLATQKVEQLKSLAWRFDVVTPLQPVSDSVTDVSQEPAAGSGAGLQPSPPNTLSLNAPGYVDFLDKHSRWVGAGPQPPPSAVFIRRWNLSALPSDPVDSLVIQVLVTTVMRESQASRLAPRRRLAGDARLVSVLTRTVR